MLDLATPGLQIEAQPVPALPDFLRCVTVTGAIVHIHTSCIVMIAEGSEYNTYVLTDGHQIRVTEATKDVIP